MSGYGKGKKYRKDGGDKKGFKRKYDTPATEDSNDVLGSEQDWVPEAASKNAEDVDVEDDEFGAKDFRSQMDLRPDHLVRPLWVAPNGHIFLEAFIQYSSGKIQIMVVRFHSEHAYPLYVYIFCIFT